MVQGPVEKMLILRAHAEKRRPPDAIINAPQLFPGSGLYFQAFLALSSSRPVGMSEGRIPWMAVFQYAQCIGLDEEEFEDLWILISQMDAEYLAYRQKKTDQGKLAATPANQAATGAVRRSNVVPKPRPV